MNWSTTHKAVVILSLVNLAGAGTWWATDQYKARKVAEQQISVQKEKLADQQQKLDASQATLHAVQEQQQQLAALDKSHTEALNAAESQNDNLRRQLAAGTRRMYVKAKCPVPGGYKAASAARVGDGTTVELTGDTGQHILDIREGIISDQQKLKYLQDYVKVLMKKPAETTGQNGD